MNLVTCTQCGASKSHYDPETGFIVCDYCGAGYTVPDEPRSEFDDFPVSGSYVNISSCYDLRPLRQLSRRMGRKSDEYFRRLGTRIDIPKFDSPPDLEARVVPKPKPKPKHWWNSLFERNKK